MLINKLLNLFANTEKKFNMTSPIQKKDKYYTAILVSYYLNLLFFAIWFAALFVCLSREMFYEAGKIIPWVFLELILIHIHFVCIESIIKTKEK
jgi:hypothetical protein